MIITAVDPIAGARAIVQILKDSQAIQDMEVKCIERGEPLNEDPSKCPWIGVYPLRVPFPPRTLGLGGGFRAENPEYAIVFQTTHPNDGAVCQDELGELIQAGTSALLSDPSLGGTVQMLGDFDVEFNGERKVNDCILQVATLRVVGLTTVSGG
jgi:hypothetical protein